MLCWNKAESGTKFQYFFFKLFILFCSIQICLQIWDNPLVLQVSNITSYILIPVQFSKESMSRSLIHSIILADVLCQDLGWSSEVTLLENISSAGALAWPRLTKKIVLWHGHQLFCKWKTQTPGNKHSMDAHNPWNCSSASKQTTTKKHVLHDL